MKYLDIKLQEKEKYGIINDVTINYRALKRVGERMRELKKFFSSEYGCWRQEEKLEFLERVFWNHEYDEDIDYIVRSSRGITQYGLVIVLLGGIVAILSLFF